MLGGFIGIKYAPYKNKFAFYFCFILGGFFFFSSTVGPVSKSQQRLDEVIQIDAEQVIEIKLKPTKRAGNKHKSLFPEIITVQDKQSIELICGALNTAHFSGLGQVKSGEWLALVETNGRDYDTSFAVDHRERTTIEVNSRGNFGWNFGTLSCDALGPILEAIAENRGSK